jgi:hypothetical protein
LEKNPHQCQEKIIEKNILGLKHKNTLQNNNSSAYYDLFMKLLSAFVKANTI